MKAGTSAVPSREQRPLPPIPPNAVRVTAADFNGSTWDGSPFRLSENGDAREWLLDALEAGRIKPEPSDRDYALWRVGDAVAEPGDLIVCDAPGGLRVVTVKEQRAGQSQTPVPKVSNGG